MDKYIKRNEILIYLKSIHNIDVDIDKWDKLIPSEYTEFVLVEIPVEKCFSTIEIVRPDLTVKYEKLDPKTRPPLVIIRFKNHLLNRGDWIPIDGYHRLLAAIKNKEKNINAYIPVIEKDELIEKTDT